MSMRFLPAFVAALVLMAGPAMAQWGRGGMTDDYGGRRIGSVQRAPTPFSNGGSCVAMCAADTTPCDPISYKLADRRCNANQNGYFPE
ncbi:hypothetical protein P7D22_18085 [Lichenihabitans sp. Uapishka_5]|uniref:hypothetical protein n=1 Tax=Lichenihabitans sp. Uapishka_5 TaxID=3037302 RepID=UPI0029E827D9|nr:hypothetical protein [Lichenihabitans sp. Uapishka_5]MDX7953075.1 hypothetical protein [Lichenihabitans sp. Uapishka_5]